MSYPYQGGQGGYGAYPPPPGGGGYAPPPQQGAYPPPQGAYPPQQGAYPPPAGGYGAPAYGAPPSQAPYGGAPAYGAPPAQAPYGGAPGYGAPPPAQPPQHHHPHHQQQPPYPQGGGYGAPPQQGYGAPAAPHQGGGYGAPASGGQLAYNGVYVPAPPPAPPAASVPGFDVQSKVDLIYKAMKGFGTDEKSLIIHIAPLTPFEADAVRASYSSLKGKNVISHVESEVSGWFEAVLRAKLLGPVLFDAYAVHRACAGAGTEEAALTDVLLCRTNSDIFILKQAFQATYGKPLERVVEDDLSFKTKRLFIMALSGARTEPHVPPHPQQVQADVETLYRAMRGAGTDEIAVMGVLANRNDAQLVAIAAEYKKAHGKRLSSALESDFSGHMKDGLLFIAQGAEDVHDHSQAASDFGVHRDARKLEEAMMGAGTKDQQLVRRILRAHWNQPRWQQIKASYAAHQHRKGLIDRVKGETSGDYERALLAVIGN